MEFRLKKLLIILPLLYLTACTSSQPEVSKGPPNIVFIFADDLTYEAVHALGNNEIRTPNLDKLVALGTTFSHAYNMGGWNGAICVASRSMIISGRSVWNANKFRQHWLQGEELDKTWGKLMEQNGYNTYMTGKWHVDAGAEQVFQNVVHIRPGMPRDEWGRLSMGQRFKEIEGTDAKLSSVMPVGYNRPLSEQDTSWSPTDPKFGGFWEGGKHWSEVLKDDAIEFINDAQAKEQPFFMYLAFNAPHDPRQAPQEYLDMYPVEEIGLPKNWLPEYPYKDSIGCSPKLRDEALAPFPRTEYATIKHIQEYYAITTHLDHQVGLIMDALEKSGRMDNTYIFFTADHGLAIGSHGLLGKQSLYDHSIRVPFMITGPDIPEGKTIKEDIYLQDVMATSLELAGIEKPDYVEFNSLLGLIDGEQNESTYPSIYGGYIDLQRMIRKNGYKLIVYPRLEQVLLFDLSNDPQEMNDLAGDAQYQSKIKELFDGLLQLQVKLNDELDLKPLHQKITTQS